VTNLSELLGLLAAVFGDVRGFLAVSLCSRFIHNTHQECEISITGVTAERLDGLGPFIYAAIVLSE